VPIIVVLHNLLQPGDQRLTCFCLFLWLAKCISTSLPWKSICASTKLNHIFLKKASVELELPTTVVFASAGRLNLLTAPSSIFLATFNLIIIIDNYHHGQLEIKHRPQSNPRRPLAPSTRKMSRSEIE
jgi:hypothetical protein